MLNEKSRASIDLSLNGSRPLYGLIIATSHYQFGSPLYSFYTPVEEVFFTKKTHRWKEVDGLIEKARAIAPATLTSEKLQQGFGALHLDDKGIILWYAAAFALFGPQLQSIYALYFLMMAGSLGLFWLSFRRDPPALMLMALYPLAHLGIAGYALASNTDIVGSLFGTRPFTMLAALPVLHLALLMLRGRAPSRWLAAGAAMQILYLLLIIEVRSSAKAQILFLLLVAVACLLKHRQKALWVPVALCIGLAGAAGMYAAAVPHELRVKTTAHPFWFSALAGFTLNPQLTDDLFQFTKVFTPNPLADRLYKPDGSMKPSPSADALAWMSITGFAKVEFDEDISGYIWGGPENANFAMVEKYGKRLLFYELARRPVEFAELYLVDKTTNLLLILGQVIRNLPLADIAVAAFILGMMAGTAWLPGFKIIVPLLATSFALSLAPSYWFVPSTISMYDFAPYLYLGILSVAAGCGAMAARFASGYSLSYYSKRYWPAVSLVVVPLAIAGALFTVRQPSDKDASTILIRAATYGETVGAPHGNATVKLRRACNGRVACEYFIDVSVLGDPATGAGKDLAVEYKCSYDLQPIRQVMPAEAHGHWLRLECPVPR
ncbi:MAG: hypothetical protein SFX19_07635 [Alphaproteobacteria bacterium]|nr:hypothetical protein [Alphaproteobacteria bacterium]